MKKSYKRWSEASIFEMMSSIGATRTFCLAVLSQTTLSCHLQLSAASFGSQPYILGIAPSFYTAPFLASIDVSTLQFPCLGLGLLGVQLQSTVPSDHRSDSTAADFRYYWSEARSRRSQIARINEGFTKSLQLSSRWTSVLWLSSCGVVALQLGTHRQSGRPKNTARVVGISTPRRQPNPSCPSASVNRLRPSVSYCLRLSPIPLHGDCYASSFR